MARQTLNNAIVEWGGTGGVPNWVKMPGVLSHEEPGAEAEEIESTDYDSVSRWSEHLTGVINGSEMSIEMNYVPGDTVAEAMRTAAYTGAKGHCRILYGNTEGATVAVTAGTAVRTLTWRGKVTWRGKGAVKDKLTATATIKPDGAITVT